MRYTPPDWYHLLSIVVSLHSEYISWRDSTQYPSIYNMCNRESGVVTPNGKFRVFMCSPITDCHDLTIKHWKLSLFITLLSLSVGSREPAQDEPADRRKDSNDDILIFPLTEDQAVKT